MTDTAKRLAGPVSVGNTETTLYTVPGATTAILRGMILANVTGSAATLKVSIGADAVGTRIVPDVTIKANSFIDWSGFLPLAAAETLRATGSVNNAFTVTISGVEVS